MDLARQAPLSMGFSRQEYWRGLPCLPPGDIANPGIKPRSLMSPALVGSFFTTSATWDPPPPQWRTQTLRSGLHMSLQCAFLIRRFNMAISTLSSLLRANLSSKVMGQLIPESLLGPSMMAGSGSIRHEQWARQTRSWLSEAEKISLIVHTQWRSGEVSRQSKGFKRI